MSRKENVESPRVATSAPGPADADQWRSRIDGASLGEVMGFLVAVGDGMISSGDPVPHIQDSLTRIAHLNGITGAEVIVLPTALMITLPGNPSTRTEVATTAAEGMRFDQVEALYTVVSDAEHGRLGSRDGLARLGEIRSAAPPFRPPVVVAGHAVIAAGLAMILSGGWPAIVVGAGLGAAVGVLKQVAAGRRTAVQILLPIGCAFGAAAVTALLYRFGVQTGLLAPLVGAIVTFIPGAVLTTAFIEVATGQVISGAGRFASGAMTLMMLALGISGGILCVGLPSITLTENSSSPIGPFGPWIGVAVFGLGVMLGNSGRLKSLGWVLLVLYVAYSAQVIGGLLLGPNLSGFVGAMVMTPVAVWVARQRSGPATLITFLPAFWLLVPGAIALVGVTTLVGSTQQSGTTTLLDAVVAMIAIAVGVLLGLTMVDSRHRLRGGPASPRTGEK